MSKYSDNFDTVFHGAPRAPAIVGSYRATDSDATTGERLSHEEGHNVYYDGRVYEVPGAREPVMAFLTPEVLRGMQSWPTLVCPCGASCAQGYGPHAADFAAPRYIEHVPPPSEWHEDPEVVAVLEAVDAGTDAVEYVQGNDPDGDSFSGNVPFRTASGWTLVVFNDCGEWDYLDHAIAPDGSVRHHELAWRPQHPERYKVGDTELTP